MQFIYFSFGPLWSEEIFWEIRNFICLDPCFLNSVLLFGPYLDLYQSLYLLFCWKLKLLYPFSGFVCQFIQGHWREFNIRNCTIWPILFFWMFILLLKEPTFIFYLRLDHQNVKAWYLRLWTVVPTRMSTPTSLSKIFQIRLRDGKRCLEFMEWRMLRLPVNRKGSCPINKIYYEYQNIFVSWVRADADEIT